MFGAEKSWRRWSLALLFILGYFLVLGWGIWCKYPLIAEKMTEGLPVLLAAIITQYVTQNGHERQQQLNGATPPGPAADA